MINIFAERISDPPTREAFQSLISILESFPWFAGKWFFLEVTLKSGDNTFSHEAGFKPTDIIQLSQTAAATINYKYSEFTKTTLKINSSAPTKIRFFFGEYNRG